MAGSNFARGDPLNDQRHIIQRGPLHIIDEHRPLRMENEGAFACGDQIQGRSVNIVEFENIALWLKVEDSVKAMSALKHESVAPTRGAWSQNQAVADKKVIALGALDAPAVPAVL